MQAQEILDVLEFIEDNDVRFIRLQFCDLFGRNRNISVSYSEFERALKDGLMFRSSGVPGYESCGEPELILYPDPTTIQSLPWRPQQGSVARVLCKVCYPDGRSFEGDSRQILTNIVEQAKKEGIEFEIGAKIEFYLFELGEDNVPTLNTVDHAGFFDLAPLDKGENTRREIILTLEEMGFAITSSHHEVGSGQHEIDFRMSDPINCADSIQTFKTVVKTVAESNGMHASFMPKPLNDQPGSGMHIMITAFKNGENIFTGPDGQLTQTAKAFAGGISRELPAICAFANPIVNSYKRLAGGFGAPDRVSWQPESHNAVIRIPNMPWDVNRLIIRNPDASANPYLLFSLLISAGLIGIEENIDPETFSTLLPETLENAINAAEKSSFVGNVLGEAITNEYLKAKRLEWQDYLGTVHDWEIKKYFDVI